ncbi:MAG: metallophosphoesterase family protein [Terracidiphilus sp.]
MRLAIISDIHGNLTAFEAVLADLRVTSPDLVLHGGDLAAGGSRPAEVIDRVRDLGWPGVLGNTDEMLYRPESLTEFATGLPHLKPLFDVIAAQAASTREVVGAERMAWLQTLPMMQRVESVALVHATSESVWKSPGPTATDAEMDAAYQKVAHPIVVYAHIHHPFARRIGPSIIANTGSVSLSYDRDPRASYLVVEDGAATIRRVAYELAAETCALAQSGLPHAEWVAQTLRAARFRMP